MRYLQFNDISIDTQSQLLIKAGEQLSLAPKVYDLLVYFCLNQQRVISKDELMDNVWTGTIVTENAISRTLVKVRKSLGDDSKSPQYIVTVPKKGYRMVAEFTSSDHIADIHMPSPDQQEKPNKEQIALTLEKQASHDLTTKKTQINEQRYSRNTKAVALITFTLLIAIMIFWQNMPAADLPMQTKQFKPLTREVGDEIHPAISGDMNKLAYTKIMTGKPSYINIEGLNDNKRMSLLHPRANLSKPVWSPASEQLAFLYQHNSVCRIYQTDIATLTDQSTWQLISECGTDSSPQFVYAEHGEFLYFNDRQSNTNGYQVFRVDLESLQKDIVNQPITSGLGNYAFDISPDGNRLVMLNSEFAPKTRIYTLELADSTLKQTASLPYLLRSVSWNHDSQTIIHPAPHPAYDVWQSDLLGNKLATIVSNTSRVKHLSRINNGKDFTFVSYLLNRDIYFQQHASGNPSPTQPQIVNLDNSSVMDYLPALANKSHQYAFVSKRTTTAEVFLANVDTPESTRQLTHFNNPVKIYHLAYSPSDTQLLIQADNQLFIANLSTNEINQLSLENIKINGASWRDEENIFFSTIKNNMWYTMQYNIPKQSLSTFPLNSQGAVFSAIDNAYYIMDDDNQVMRMTDLNASPQAINLQCSPSFINRKLNLATTASGLTCLSTSNKQSLAHFNLYDQTLSFTDKPASDLDFSSNQQGNIFTKMTQSMADTVRTVSQ